jgi:hypothetical protein
MKSLHCSEQKLSNQDVIHPIMECPIRSLVFTRIPFREEDRLLRLLQAEADFLQMTEKEFEEIIRFFVLPLGWAFPPGIVKIFRAAAEQLGGFSKNGNGSNGISPIMLSTQNYQLLGIQVEHIYFTSHLPHTFSASRE